jgi:hypothetical protein
MMPFKITLSEQQVIKARYLYDQNYNRSEIVTQIGVSEWSIRKALQGYCKPLGVKLKEFHKKNSISITDEQLQCILGTLLGDASLSYRERDDVYEYQLSHCEEQKEYIEHIASLLKTNCNSFIKDDNSFSAGKVYYKLSYHNKYELEKIAALTIKNGIKTLSKTWVSLLGPLAIAYWFMDDGSSSWLKNSPSVMVRFATLSFPENEVKLLQNKLSNYGIATTLQNHTDGFGKIIYIRQDSVNNFMDIVEPILIRRKLHNMLYKIKRRVYEK